jgi:hypothetical protein
MATTTYLELDDQATGANSNTWGDVADANMAIIEQAIARYVDIATTGGTTILTSAQNRYPIIRVTGALVSNATIQVRTAEKNWIVINATTGAYTLTVKTSAGTGKTIPRGRAVTVYCDGTNVELVRSPIIPTAQAGGTVDAITATFEPAFTAAELVDGTIFMVEAAGANTSTTPTFAPDGNTARTITKFGGQALVAGDIRAAGHKCLFMYDESSTRYELLNPSDAVGLNPQFTTIEIGHASDTTLSRASAGRIAVEGVEVALSTDVVGQQTIWVPAGAMVARTTNGAASGSFETTTNDVMLKYLAFDASTKEGAQFGIQMPKGWDEGTLIAQFVWTHPSTTTNFGVSWELAAVAFANDDAADTAFGTLQEIDDTGGTTYDIYISDETPAITVAGSPGAEEYVIFQVTRDPADAGDTMAVDAWLLGVKIHYTTNAAKDD